MLSMFLLLLVLLKFFLFSLIFNFTSSAYWELVNADVRTISLDGAEEGGVPVSF